MASGTFSNWGPYLCYGTDSSTEMRIAWKTERFTFQNNLLYGTTPECDQLAEVILPTASQHHVIILNNLEPSTQYYYKICRDPAIISTFTTGPTLGSTEPFEFLMAGDMHAAPVNNLKPGFKAMLDVAPNHAFIITLGDCITER